MRYTTDTFIKKANVIHNNKFSYNKSVYVNWSQKLVVTCSIHGDFEQTPRDHLSGRGCNKCGRIKTAAGQRTPLSKFMLVANKRYNGKFSYAKSKYINARTNLEIICPKHGSFFQTPDTHLRSVYGCLKCSQEALGRNSRSCTEQFTKKANKAYPNKFNYQNTIYLTAIAPITVTCNSCQMAFETTPNKHLSCGACPNCDHRGFVYIKPAILYYLSVNNGQAYKIGITNQTVQKRYCKEELERIKILKTWEYAVGKEAYQAEQFYLNEYKYAKYVGEPLLLAGNTELFNQDVLLLDS